MQIVTQMTWSGYTNIPQNRLKEKIITGDKERHFIIIKASIHQEDTTILNIQSPNSRTPKCIK